GGRESAGGLRRGSCGNDPGPGAARGPPRPGPDFLFQVSVMPQSSNAAHFEASARAGGTVVHPLIVRLTHWLNAVAMIVMIMSGWQIHNAYPTLSFRFPDVLTIGSGLAGALQWHFAAMWLLAVNGAIYLSYGALSGRFRRELHAIYPS